ncbi:MAG: MazG family protein [Pseudonocardiaceae bacterium]|nr:MazG family protein [Pseudonocardiaceae bacterium]
MTPWRAAEGCAVVLIDERLGPALAAEAVPLLRSAYTVYASAGLGEQAKKSLGAHDEPGLAELLGHAARSPVVLIASRADDAAATALRDAGAHLVPAPRLAGGGLLDAVAVMDRLRSPGGCPWDAEQTHNSLRQYLVEETYELLDAIEQDDRGALREELGDVLLQVLFHARVAAEDASDPFTIDDVAEALVAKLVGRHPHVFSGGDPAVRDAHSQQVRWEELKQSEKRRESIVDGVALGQPAIALAAKLGSRTGRAGLPLDLLPGGADAAEELFRVAVRAKRGGAEPEGELRAVARRFVDDVRAAERAARADGLNPETLEAEGWRCYWPR